MKDTDLKESCHDVIGLVTRQILGVTLVDPENLEVLGVSAVVRNGRPTDTNATANNHFGESNFLLCL